MKRYFSFVPCSACGHKPTVKVHFMDANKKVTVFHYCAKCDPNSGIAEEYQRLKELQFNG